MKFLRTPFCIERFWWLFLTKNYDALEMRPYNLQDIHLKVACRVQIWKKHFVKIVQSLVTVLFKETLYLCIYFVFMKKTLFWAYLKHTLNCIMSIWTILTWSLKTYVIRFHNLISMNIFFTERSVFLYNCKETSENK